MKKEIFRVVACILIINITITSLFLLINSYCATREFNSKYGESPLIDGYIDLSTREWNQAFKGEIYLEDFPIDLWVMQDDKNLYISVQFDLSPGYHSINEFIGIIVSNSSSENKEDFIDAKIVQFINISADEYDYIDYKINNSVFLIDSEENGEGAAKLEELTSTYEFSLPIQSSNGNEEDAALDYGNSYAFNITYGESIDFPSGIKKSVLVLINIKSLPDIVPSIINSVLYVLSIIVFSVLGIFLGFYIYRIFKLKEYIEKYRR